jgi:hypothetical protein
MTGAEQEWTGRTRAAPGFARRVLNPQWFELKRDVMTGAAVGQVSVLDTDGSRLRGFWAGQRECSAPLVPELLLSG